MSSLRQRLSFIRHPVRVLLAAGAVAALFVSVTAASAVTGTPNDPGWADQQNLYDHAGAPACGIRQPDPEDAAGMGDNATACSIQLPAAMGQLVRPLSVVPIAFADTGVDLASGQHASADLAGNLWSPPANSVSLPTDTLTGANTYLPTSAHGWDFLGNLPEGDYDDFESSLTAGYTAPDDLGGDITLSGTRNAVITAGGTTVAYPTDPPDSFSNQIQSQSDDPQDSDGSFGNGGSGHGTEVASIAASPQNADRGITGIAPNGRIMALRTCWTGAGDCPQSALDAAFNWATGDAGARVVNMSFIYGSDDDMIANDIASHPRALFVATTDGGMSNGEPEFPCNDNQHKSTDTYPLNGQVVSVYDPNLICVVPDSSDGEPCLGITSKASLDFPDIAAGTNNGAMVGFPGPDFTTLAGLVGTDIYATGTVHCFPSVAAPMVSGIAATLFGLDPNATGAEVKAAILAGADYNRQLAGFAHDRQLDDLGAVTAFQAAMFTPKFTSLKARLLPPGHLEDITGMITNPGRLNTFEVSATGPGISSAPERVAVDGTFKLSVSRTGTALSATAKVTVFSNAHGAPSWAQPAKDVLEISKDISFHF